MKELGSPLERLFAAAPGKYTVKKVEHGGRAGGEVSVTDPVGTQLLLASVSPSNTGETCCIAVHRYTYHSEWDEQKVTSMVAYGFYAVACSKPAASLEAKALRELRNRRLVEGLVPPAVTDAVRAVHELYQAARGEDVVRAWEEMRKLMGRLSKRGATEDEVVRAWRETLVTEVQES